MTYYKIVNHYNGILYNIVNWTKSGKYRMSKLRPTVHTHENIVATTWQCRLNVTRYALLESFFRYDLLQHLQHHLPWLQVSSKKAQRWPFIFSQHVVNILSWSSCGDLICRYTFVVFAMPQTSESSKTVLFFRVLSKYMWCVPISGSHGQSLCQNTIYGTESACVAIGCYWTGSACRQPQECAAQSNDIVTYNGMQTGVKVVRYPLDPEVVRLCNDNTECSAMYQVTMMPKFVTGPPNCNDYAMLPPHGVDQTECAQVDPSAYPAGDMKDYLGHPFPDDGVKQSVAKAELSVTALTESGDNCSTTRFPDRNPQCAFPLGFKSDTIIKNLGICVEITGVQDKWVEIMASSREGSNGASYCARDRNAKINHEEACTVSGDLIDIRESGNSIGSDNMNIMFYARDNNDDAQMSILWRISASHMPSTDPSVAEKDAEDWSLYRNGGDFPSALMEPYPANFEGEPVFEASTESSGSWSVPSIFVVFASAVLSFIFV